MTGILDSSSYEKCLQELSCAVLNLMDSVVMLKVKTFLANGQSRQSTGEGQANCYYVSAHVVTDRERKDFAQEEVDYAQVGELTTPRWGRFPKKTKSIKTATTGSRPNKENKGCVS